MKILAESVNIQQDNPSKSEEFKEEWMQKVRMNPSILDELDFDVCK